MTEYTLRIVMVCPATMLDDANSYAMCNGYGPADGETFRAANYTRGGVSYAVAAPVTTPTFPARASSPPERPAWDAEPYEVNLTGAERAQAALTVCTPDALVMPAPGRLLAVVVPDTSPEAAHAVIDALGLVRVEAEI